MMTFKQRHLGGNPLQRSGSESEPDPEPNCEFAPVASTNPDAPDEPEPLTRLNH